MPPIRVLSTREPGTEKQTDPISFRRTGCPRLVAYGGLPILGTSVRSGILAAFGHAYCRSLPSRARSPAERVTVSATASSAPSQDCLVIGLSVLAGDFSKVGRRSSRPYARSRYARRSRDGQSSHSFRNRAHPSGRASNCATSDSMTGSNSAITRTRRLSLSVSTPSSPYCSSAWCGVGTRRVLCRRSGNRPSSPRRERRVTVVVSVLPTRIP